MTSTSLAELLDPDKWIASGKNLTDFPWPDGANEREAMELILCARPMLNAHVERWSKLAMKTLGRRGGENVGDVLWKNISVNCGSGHASRVSPSA
jgi:hypothetical protein